MSEFDSAWRKWQRASVHAEELKRCLPATWPPSPYVQPFLAEPVETEYDAKRHCVIFRWGPMAEPSPSWSVLLGDFIFNMTSALDHLAFAVVNRGKYAGSLTDEDRKGIYFPYCFSASAFTRELDRGRKGKPRLVGVRLADSSRIRRYQPYQAGKRNAPKHCLAILNKCSNRDKHRELTPLWMQSKHFSFQVSHASECSVTRNALPRFPIERIEPKAEFGRVYVRRTGPNPNVYLNGVFSAQIAIYEGVPVKGWLNQVLGCVGSLLREFADPPGDVVYISEAEWADLTNAHDPPR